MTFRTLDDAGDLAGKTALVRVDFNVPMDGGRITDDTRLRVALPTIRELREAGAKVALLAHFDRPKGKVVPSMSLQTSGRAAVGTARARRCAFADDCVGPDAAGGHRRPGRRRRGPAGERPLPRRRGGQ